MDMKWICDRAIIRADQFGIKGVDYKLTMGVIKNIIPAIASTNALVSAACVNECVKILTGCNYRLKNASYCYGQTRMNISQQCDQQKADCLVCSRGKAKVFTVKPTQKLQEFLDQITADLTLQGPTISHGNNTLCSRGFLGKGIEFKLELTWEELIAQGHFSLSWELGMVDKSIASSVNLSIKFE